MFPPIPPQRVHRNVSGASYAGRPDNARLLDPAQTRFTERLLNLPTARTAHGLSPASGQRSNKGPAPQPPRWQQPWTPPAVLRLESVNASVNASVNKARPQSSGWKEVSEGEARSLLRPGQAPETPSARAPHPLGGALPLHLADPPPTRYQRVKRRLAQAVPLPLRRAWRAVDAAVHRLIDRLRPQAASAQA